MKKFMQVISMVLLITMVFQVVAYGAENIPESRSIRLYEIDGNSDGVTITRGAKKELRGAEGMALTANDKVTTDTSTVVYLEIDENKVVKLDKNTSISISKASSKSLQITLISGEVYFDTKGKLESDSELAFTAGGMTMGVRGTSGTIGNDRAEVKTSVYSGTVEVATSTGQRISVSAGYYNVMETDGVVVIESAPINAEEMSSFALETIVEALTSIPADEEEAEAQTALKSIMGIEDGETGETQIRALETLATQAAAKEAETEAEQQVILDELKKALNELGTTEKEQIGTLDPSITNQGQTPTGAGSSSGSDIKYYTATDTTDWATFSGWLAQDGGVNVVIPAGVTFDFSPNDLTIPSGKSLSIAGTLKVNHINVEGGGVNNSGALNISGFTIKSGTFNNSGSANAAIAVHGGTYTHSSKAIHDGSASIKAVDMQGGTLINSESLENVTVYANCNIQNTGMITNINTTYANQMTLNLKSTGAIGNIVGSQKVTLAIESWNASSTQKLYSDFDGSALTPVGGLTAGFEGTYMWAAAAGAWVKVAEGESDTYHHTSEKAISDLEAAINAWYVKTISIEGGPTADDANYMLKDIIVPENVKASFTLPEGFSTINSFVNKGELTLDVAANNILNLQLTNEGTIIVDSAYELQRVGNAGGTVIAQNGDYTETSLGIVDLVLDDVTLTVESGTVFTKPIKIASGTGESVTIVNNGTLKSISYPSTSKPEDGTTLTITNNAIIEEVGDLGTLPTAGVATEYTWSSSANSGNGGWITN